MNEEFEKIMERLRNSVDKGCVSSVPKVRLCDAVQIVQEVAEEYKGGWIPCSGCKDCKNKECEHNGKV